MVHTITDVDFNRVVNNAEKPVLLQFWAPWSTPCRITTISVDAVSQQFEGKLIMARANVDETPEICKMFGIKTIPTLLLFKNGKAISVLYGAQQKDRLAKKLEEFLG